MSESLSTIPPPLKRPKLQLRPGPSITYLRRGEVFVEPLQAHDYGMTKTLRRRRLSRATEESFEGHANPFLKFGNRNGIEFNPELEPLSTFFDKMLRDGPEQETGKLKTVMALRLTSLWFELMAARCNFLPENPTLDMFAIDISVARVELLPPYHPVDLKKPNAEGLYVIPSHSFVALQEDSMGRYDSRHKGVVLECFQAAGAWSDK